MLRKPYARAYHKRSRQLKRNQPYDRTVYQSITMIFQFGINMVVPITMMTALGVYLDRKLGTPYITILLFFIGAVAGGQNVYRMAKGIYGKSNDHTGKEVKDQK